MKIEVLPDDTIHAPCRFAVYDNQGNLKAMFVEEEEAQFYVDAKTQWSIPPL